MLLILMLGLAGQGPRVAAAETANGTSGDSSGYMQTALQAESITAPQGSIVPIRFWLINPGSIIGGSFTLEYDPQVIEPVLQGDRIQVDPGAFGGSAAGSLQSSGRINIAVAGTNPASDPEAVLCTVYFKLLQEGSSPLQITVAESTNGSYLQPTCPVNGAGIGVIARVAAGVNKDSYANNHPPVIVQVAGKVYATVLPPDIKDIVRLQIFNAHSQTTVDMDELPVDREGNFSGQWTVPADVSAGNYSLQAVHGGYIYTDLDSFTLYHLEKPLASPDHYIFYPSQTVELTCPTEGAEIYYTLNEDEPDTNSRKYIPGNPIDLTDTTTIKAIAHKDGITSETASFTYTRSNQPVDECFIATASYGSKFAPPVVLLREFRDRFLLTNASGKAFVACYYHYSPPIAAYIAGKEPFKLLVRIVLAPLVAVAYLLLHPWLMYVLMGGLFIVMIIGSRKKKAGLPI